MVNMLAVEVWVIVDADGNSAADTDYDVCLEKYHDGDNNGPTRMVKITVNVPAPSPVEVEVTVPDEPQEATATVR